MKAQQVLEHRETRKSRKNVLLTGLAALAVSVAVTWICIAWAPPEPRIEFVEFERKSKSKWIARFRVVNDSPSYYSYIGSDQVTPQYELRCFDGTNWSQESRMTSQWTLLEMPPGSSQEFQVPAQHSLFQVGVHFSKGRRSAMTRRRHSFAHWMEAPFSFIRTKLNFPGLPATWSETAKLPFYDSAGLKISDRRNAVNR